MRIKRRLKLAKNLLKIFYKTVILGYDQYMLSDNVVTYGTLQDGKPAMSASMKVRTHEDGFEEEHLWLMCFDGKEAYGFIDNICVSGDGAINTPFDFKGSGIRTSIGTLNSEVKGE